MKMGDRYTRRCKRLNIAGHAHELTFGCFGYRPHLRDPKVCAYLVDAINAARDRHAFDLWAYVFMPDHVHLLICPRRENYSVSIILQAIKQPVARRAITYLKQKDPSRLQWLETGMSSKPYCFWQRGGGYDRNITSTETLIHSLRYIHQNPVEKELVSAPDDWKYSSAGEWQEPGSGPLAIDFENWPLA